jgi:4-hydroxybenzoate polyprenyltransferase
MEQDDKIKALLDLGRVANLPTVWSNVIAAWLLGGGEHVWRVFPLIAGASLLYCGGTTLNDAVDAEFDREHRPERPIPAGIFTEKQVWKIGGGMLGVGALTMVLLAKASLVWVLPLVAAILAYDFLHKQWKGSVFIMGACRTFLYFAAASTAVDRGLGLNWPVVLWGLALLLYIAGLSFAAREESKGKSLVGRPLILLAAPIVAWMILAFNDISPLVKLLGLAGTVGWTGYAIFRVRRDHEDEDRIGNFVGNLLAGIVLVDAAAVASSVGWPFLIFAGMLPFTLALQQRFTST